MFIYMYIMTQICVVHMVHEITRNCAIDAYTSCQNHAKWQIPACRDNDIKFCTSCDSAAQ